MAERQVSVRLTCLVGDYQRAMAQAEGSTKKLAGEVDRSTKRNNGNLKTLGTVGLAAGGALAFGLTKVVGASMGFSKQMSGVKAVAGATADQMGLLGEAALKAGADTIFSASEAAMAEAELVKAGISTSDVLGGALTGSLNLAAAGQLDLAKAAEISAQAMNIFGLEGADVSHIADVLAAGANKSAADVGQLGDALRQGGLVAAQTGLSLEETVGALSAFADSALVGSDAGTSLKSMLQRLTPQSAEAAGLMEKLGFSAYDAQGNFIGLEGLAGELQESLGGLTVEQRNTALATIFGSDAVRGANVLYEQGAAGIAGYVTAVNDQGAATRMAAELTNNLAGDLEQLGGSFETVFITAGAGASGALRFLVQGMTGLVNTVGSAPPVLQTTALGLTALTSGALLTLGAIGTLVPRIREGREALVGLGSAGATANDMLGKLGRAAGAATVISGVALALNELDQASARTGMSSSELGEKLLDAAASADPLGQVARLLGTDIEGLNEKLTLATRNPWDIRHILDIDEARDAQSAFAELDSTLAELFALGRVDEAKALYDAVANTYGVEKAEQAFGTYNDALARSRIEAEATTGAASGLTGAMGGLNEATGESIAVTEEQQAANDALAETYEALAGSLAGFADPMEAYNTVLDRNTEAARAHAEGVAESTEDAGDSWEDYVGDVGVSLTEYADQLQKQIDDQNNWANNLKIIAGRGREDVARILAEMGPEGAALAAEYANATGAEFERAADLRVEATRRGSTEAGQELDTGLKVMGEIARQGASATAQSVAEALGVMPGDVARIAEEANVALRNAEPGWAESFTRRGGFAMARLQELQDNSRANVTSTAGGMNSALNANLQGWYDQFLARSNNASGRMQEMRNIVPPIVGATAGAMTGALGGGLPGFTGVVDQYQNSLASGVSTVRLSLRDEVRGRPYADGGIVEAYANGGLKESHQAQIARAGDWRVWAEPETGGEAYIPLAQAKRERSLDILREVADRFGMELTPPVLDFHSGGLYNPPDAPGLPGYGPPIRPAGEDTMEGSEAYVREWARRHMDLPHHQAPPPGSGITGGAGGGGKALDRVRAAMADNPGLRITSTYRSPSVNASVGGARNSLHMDRANPAVDIGGPTGALDRFHAELRGMGGWRELLWRVAGHFDHVHVAHEGGLVDRSWPTIAGLRSDERPAILQVGETVLPRGAGGVYSPSYSFNFNAPIYGVNDLQGAIRGELDRHDQEMVSAQRAGVH